jgi:hypothetical protein
MNGSLVIRFLRVEIEVNMIKTFTVLLILSFLLFSCQDDFILTIDGDCYPYREQIESALGYIDEIDYKWENKNVCKYDGRIRQDIDNPCLFCAVASECTNSGPDTLLGGANREGDVVVFVDRWSNLTPLFFHELAHYCGYPASHPNSETGDWLYGWMDPYPEPTEMDLKNIEKYCSI